MSATLRPLALIISALCAAPALADASSLEEVERITVKGVSFDDYKNDSARGAMRADIPLLNTPQSVTVIPEIIIDEQLATTLGEVLTNDASITGGTKFWNRESFNSRGFKISNDGYMRDGHQFWAYYVPPIETSEQIEVLKGPSSMLYGKTAPGGLVNMVSKKPTHDRFVDVGFDFDDQGSTRYQIDTGGRIDEEGNFRYRAVGVKQDVTFWRQYGDGSDHERDRWLGYLNLEADIGDWGMVSVYYDKTNDESGNDSGAWLDLDGNVVGDRRTAWDMPWANFDNEVENYGADLTVYLGMDWQMKVGYNQNEFNRHRFDSSPRYNSYNSADQTYTVSPFSRFDDWQYTSYYVDFTGEFSTGGIEHNMLIGANRLEYYYLQRRQSGDTYTITYGDASSIPARPDLDYNRVEAGDPTEWDYYGIYVQDLITLNDQWQVLIGGRYDQQTKGDYDGNSAFLPRVGAIFHPNQDSSIYLSYSESFTPQGSVNDEDDVNDGMELDPELAKSWELGAKWELSEGRLLLSGALFNTEVTNFTFTEDLPGGGDNESITTQGGKQRHRGIEAAAQGQISENFFLMGSVMYLDAEYIEHPEYEPGITPVDAPEWSASIWSRYQFDNQLALNLGAIYEGERFANDGNTTFDGETVAANTIVKDAYVRFDAGASYPLKWGNTEIDLRANIENLFDTDYLGGGTNSNVTVSEGRKFRMSVTVGF
ncbi:TonB-dependent siderophore receptor [Ferrimonas marina]|uniref:Iron complex outermembrane recepter protein n=1 Tax=Ferrimonas marina TaxID=299255 RepID=A0A1M5VBU5_9GAMM|nr:TonB-dependent receptor [Ferrimonas marina]SHH72671.1 iron complex outermembrane recepter protein [Ferrimonas marina]